LAIRIVDDPWPHPTSATDDAVERRQPRRDQVGVVAGPEEPLAALVHVVVVLVPADSFAGPGGLGDPRRVDDRPEGDLEEAWQVCRAVRVGQRERLLGRKRVAAALRVVLDVPTGGLGVQPLPHVPLRSAGALGELRRRQRPGTGERLVETEPVAHHDQRGVQRRADLVHGAEDERFQLLHVERRLFDCCHCSSFGFRRR
jgi:hypothetical protein